MNKPSYLLLFFVLVSAGISSACTDADEENFYQVILGVWDQSSPFYDDPTRVYRNQYHFKPDGTFEYSSRVLTVGEEGTTEQGYLARQTGSFRFVADTLMFENVRHYGLDGEHEMLPREQLILHHDGHYYEMMVGFDERRDNLTLGRPCPPNAKCSGPQTYDRER